MEVEQFVKMRQTYIDQIRELLNSAMRVLARAEGKDPDEDVEYKNRSTVIVAEIMLLETLIEIGDSINRLEAFGTDTAEERRALENIAQAIRIMSDTLTMNAGK